MITPILITPAIIKMVHRIAEKDGMPKGLKITNHTGKVLYDSTWIAGVDYDEDEFEDEDYDSNSDEDEDSKDSNDDNFAYVFFSVLVCLSVLTMSFPAPCADSARLPGRLTCHAVLLSLLKKSGKVLVTLFPRFPPPWPSHTIAAQSFWCDKNSYESRGMFSTETIPSPMRKPWCHFPHKNWAGKSQKLRQYVKP